MDFCESLDPLKSLNYGLAHGALAMTIPGDTSFVQIDEVKILSKVDLLGLEDEFSLIFAKVFRF